MKTSASHIDSAQAVDSRHSATGRVLELENELESTYRRKYFVPGKLVHSLVLVLRRLAKPANVLEVLGLLAFWLLLSLASSRGLGSAPWFGDRAFTVVISVILVLAALRLFRADRLTLQNEEVQRAQIQAVLARIASVVFARSRRSRVTWFRPDVLRKDILVPFARYDPYRPDPKPKSRVFYPLGVSYTGLAAKFPGHYIVYQCPEFKNDEEMSSHYESAIRIPSEIVERVSPYMIHVRTVVSYGIELGFPRRELLGVISVDLLESVDDMLWDDFFPEDEFRMLVQSLADIEATLRRLCS